ncbi:MAG: betaine-aldehyde dehydrogenase [Gammaproteobacteria bacterium]|nr:MAG: betaine-aldehyde dehydrogenase [Gammaproteobacteria bacterium]
MHIIKPYINGQFIDASGTETFPAINPANGEVYATVQQCSDSDIDQAVRAAKQGQKIWAAMSGIARARVLHKAVAMLRERNDELAELEVLDTGKPLQEANCVDIVTGADVIEYFAGIADKIEGKYQDLGGGNYFYTRQEPLGVVAGIGAWNYPMQIAMWKSAPALAAGNAMIFKPSEETPLTAGKLAEIYTEAGLPDGVFNVLQGNYRVGKALTEHPGIDKISFTGSVPTGKMVMQGAAKTLKETTMELGGKSPLIIFDDTSVDTAVSAAMLANFYTQGEVCTNGTRVFVHEKLYDDFCAELKHRTEAMLIGDPMDINTQVGALISEKHLHKVLGYIDAAKHAGASLLCGGERATENSLDKGFFVKPTVFLHNTADMPHVKEEIFGPVMSVMTFNDEAAVIKAANHTELGLAAGVFTRDISRAHRVIAQLQAGICWINSWGASPAEMPVGGYKQSGIGRENGIQTLYAYTQTKSVYVQLDEFERPY